MEDSISKSAERKVWWRHWSIVFILAVLAGLIIWVMLNLGPWLRSWQDERAAKSAPKQLKKIYPLDKNKNKKGAYYERPSKRQFIQFLSVSFFHKRLIFHTPLGYFSNLTVLEYSPASMGTF